MLLLGGLRADGRSSPSRARPAEVAISIYLFLVWTETEEYVRLSCDSSSYDHGPPARRTNLRELTSRKIALSPESFFSWRTLSLCPASRACRNQKARLSGPREFGLSGNIQDSDEDRRRKEGRHALPMSNQRNGGRTISCSPRCANLDSRNQGNKRSERAGCVVFIIIILPFLSKEGGVVS